MNRIPLGLFHSWKPGERRVIQEQNLEILVVRTETDLVAVQNRCPHAGVSLFHFGNLEKTTLRCTRHDLRFSLDCGASDGGLGLHVYTVDIDNEGQAYIDLGRELWLKNRGKQELWN